MPGPNVVRDGIMVPGTRGTHGKRRDQRLARMVNRVFELREEGRSIREIREALHTSETAINEILHNTAHITRRLTHYNERLRAATPKALKVVNEILDSTAPQLAGERSRMAMWVLESTKTVGKESPVNIFIKGGDTNITMSNDTLEAARAVAAAMKAAPLSLPENVIDVTPIEEREEQIDEHTGVNVGVPDQASDKNGEGDGTL